MARGQSQLDYTIAKALEGLSLEAAVVNQYIDGFLKGEPSGLYEAAAYLPKLGGKRLRPFVAITCGRLFGNAHAALYYSAMSVELLHNFTLVHDDIMDKDTLRRGHPTAHAKYGETIAILAGDLLFSKAFEAAALAERHSSEQGITEELAIASVRVDEGQYLDIDFEHRESVKLGEYLQMIYLKTAALYECAARIGGKVGGMDGPVRKRASTEELAALSEFGRFLGLAFQIRDDYLGMFGDSAKTGKAAGNDLLRGKKTAIVIAAFEAGSRSQLEQIKRVLGKHQAEESEVRSALDVLKQTGADTRCTALAGEYYEKAVGALDLFGDSSQRQHLVALAKFAITRET